MTDHRRNYQKRGFWTWFFIIMGVLALLSFVLTRCDVMHLKWKSQVTPTPTGHIAQVPVPSSQLPIPFPTNHPNDEGIIDIDGNNVNEMKQGDLGIFSAKATLTKVNPTNTDVASMIAYGKKYLGTPYEYGSDRKTDKTFDCSDAVQWFYKKLGMQLPLDSRAQQQYVKQFGSHRWADWHRASAGDLFFFSSYRGNKPENYADVERDITPIAHVGIFLGVENGKYMILHTASNPTGVRIQSMDESMLKYRLVYSGRPY